MFIKNVSTEDILNYDCGYENIISVKAGEVVEIVDERAAKSFLRLLSPTVEVTEKPVAKEVKVKEEIKKEKPVVKGFKKILKKK